MVRIKGNMEARLGERKCWGHRGGGYVLGRTKSERAMSRQVWTLGEARAPAGLRNHTHKEDDVRIYLLVET